MGRFGPASSACGTIRRDHVIDFIDMKPFHGAGRQAGAFARWEEIALKKEPGARTGFRDQRASEWWSLRNPAKAEPAEDDHGTCPQEGRAPIGGGRGKVPSPEGTVSTSPGRGAGRLQRVVKKGRNRWL